MWKNAVEPDRPHITTWRICIACWITKATNTLSEYVILFAFPLQQWLRERATAYVLRTQPFLFCDVIGNAVV